MFVFVISYKTSVKIFSKGLDKTHTVCYNLSSDLLYSVFGGGKMLEKGVNISLLLESYGELLTERQREIVGLYRNDDLSLGEISEITGITRQGVSECIRKAEKELIEFEEKLGLQKAYEARKEILDGVKRTLETLVSTGKIDREIASQIVTSLEKAEN